MTPVAEEIENVSDIVVKEVQSTNVEEKPVENQSLNTTNKTDCIIVIGAYKAQKNIDKLTSSLTDDGYDIFKTPYKGTTRVGVYQPCDHNTIQTTLLSIRKKYAKDAMILRSTK